MRQGLALPTSSLLVALFAWCASTAPPARADETPPNWPGTAWVQTDNDYWGEGWFEVYSCGGEYNQYPQYMDEDGFPEEEQYFLYSGLFGTGGGYCPSFCPGDTPETQGYDNPWNMYFDTLSPYPQDFAGRSCFKFYWSGASSQCCYDRWQVKALVFGSTEFDGDQEWYNSHGCGWGVYDEALIWADYVLGTPLGKMDSLKADDTDNEGFLYMWPVALGSYGYMAHEAYTCSGNNSSYCGCPVYDTVSNSCYKDLFCYQPANYVVRVFYGVTEGDDADANWDGEPTYVINDYNMWWFPPSSSTRCYYMRGIMGASPCLCCSEEVWGDG
jgi:hypothetical protein